MKKTFHRESRRTRHPKAHVRYDRWFEKLMNGAYLGRRTRRRGHSRQYKRSAFTFALWRHHNKLPF